MNLVDPSKVPVIIGIGECNDRPATGAEGLDALQLMLAALREAERDVGHNVLGRLDWLGIVQQISFPRDDFGAALAAQLPRAPGAVSITEEPSGDGPVRLLNDAANQIGAGEIAIAAIVGGEAMRTAAMRARETGEQHGAAMAAALDAIAKPAWRRFGLMAAVDVYPLYEQACRAAWGQTLAEAQHENGVIGAGFAQVAAENPHAWSRQPVSAAEIAEPSEGNRMISFPYTKLMVANSMVNQGAAIIVASLAKARELGLDEGRLVYIGAGAAAHEPEDFLLRDSYAHSPSLEASIRACLDRNGLTAGNLDVVELYSCFPCIPKMARRELGLAADFPLSVYGGLTFGGGPIANCMTHAAAAMVRSIRNGADNGMIVSNGGYATHNHAIVLRATPPQHGTFPQDYSAQDLADAARGRVPALDQAYAGPAEIETFSVSYGRDGRPVRATVLARTPSGERAIAAVESVDSETLRLLTDGVREPVGRAGTCALDGSGTPIWRFAP